MTLYLSVVYSLVYMCAAPDVGLRPWDFFIFSKFFYNSNPLLCRCINVCVYLDTSNPFIYVVIIFLNEFLEWRDSFMKNKNTDINLCWISYLDGHLIFLFLISKYLKKLLHSIFFFITKIPSYCRFHGWINEWILKTAWIIDIKCLLLSALLV